ncbi:MCR_0457 family protein [Acinetobacter sp. 22323]|uniref:MCR_0457 family protein n=1 Tax=Acinetobacter sp. 22323 TaxID=3453910 RepID=UPI003F834D01
MMIKNTVAVAALALALTAGLSSPAFSAENLSAEVDLTIKEDLASVQVLTEVCPGIVGKNAKFEQNTQQLIKQYLSDYSDKSMTYDKIQQDKEYQSALQEARQEAKQTAKDEHQAVCNDLITQQI